MLVLREWSLLYGVGPDRYVGGFVGELHTHTHTHTGQANTYRHQIGGVPAGHEGGADDGAEVSGGGPGGVLGDLIG